MISTPKRSTCARCRSLQRTNADLHQSTRESLLHDSCERRSVRALVALVVVVQIRVRVEVQDVHRTALGMNRAQHRIRHRVIAADANRAMTFAQWCEDRSLDDVIVAVCLTQRRIPAVIDDQIEAELAPVLGCDRVGIASERGANERGPFGGPAQVGRMPIGRQTDQCKGRLHRRIMPDSS